jgi:hypothetical protein
MVSEAPAKVGGASKSSRPRKDESPDVKQSKALSYILRHGAVKEGLKLRPDGFVRVDDLVRLSPPSQVFSRSHCIYFGFTELFKSSSGQNSVTSTFPRSNA